MARLFLGTFIDPAIFKDIYGQIQSDFDQTLEGKWVEYENLHFTYCFIGDASDVTAINIYHQLSPYLREYQSPVLIRGISAFPDPRKPKILYAQVYDKSGTIMDVQRNMEMQLVRFGITPEKRKFRPHIAINRIKSAHIYKYKQMYDKYRDYNFGVMNSFRIDLIESKLTREGPVYKKFMHFEGLDDYDE